MQFWSNLEAQLEQGAPIVLVLVADNTRHSPGTRGARMFVTRQGLQEGTIGGGIMELEVLKQVPRMLAEGTWKIETLHHRKSGEGAKSGMICAGQQTNITLVLDEQHLGAVSDLAHLELEDKPGELVIDSSGGFEVRQGMGKGPMASLTQNGDAWTYRETIFLWKRAAIMGAGHCGLALSEVLARLGYVVTVFDTREDLQTLNDNLFARYIRVVDDYADAAPQLTYDAYTHVVVMTADFPGDTRALEGVWLSGKAFPYVGLMGSPAKIRAIFSELKNRGVSDAFLQSLHAPVGLPMKSNRPEEIAISVAAEILQLRDTIFAENRWRDADQ